MFQWILILPPKFACLEARHSTAILLCSLVSNLRGKGKKSSALKDDFPLSLLSVEGCQGSKQKAEQVIRRWCCLHEAEFHQ